MKAINLSHFKKKCTDVSRTLPRTGLENSKGLQDREKRDLFKMSNAKTHAKT